VFVSDPRSRFRATAEEATTGTDRRFPVEPELIEGNRKTKHNRENSFKVEI
jgi:hypothetical protein